MLHSLLFLLAIVLPPKPSRYVTDVPNVLGTQRAEALNAKLAQFERDTSNQVLVYVDRNLPPDTTLEEMGSQAIREWGVGGKGKDNGAILFLFTGARKMRIEVGYGLESTLTDAKAKRITSTVIKPLIQKGDTAGAIEAGAEAMLAAIRGSEFQGTGTTHAQASPLRNLPWLVLGIGLVGVFVALLIVLIRRSRRGGSGWVSGSTPADSWSSSSDSSSWSSSSSSDSSSSSSSDSFSGGGGDGGGGGASDSW